MPGSEFLGRVKSFGSRRHHHPNRLENVSLNRTPKRSGRGEVVHEQQGDEYLPSSATAATSSHQVSPQPMDRISKSRQHHIRSDHSLSQSAHHGFLDRELIGLALGSPRESSLPALPAAETNNIEKRCQSPTSTSTLQSGSSTSTSILEVEKPSGMKWRNLGGFFGKKASNASTQPSALFYQAEPLDRGGNLQQPPLQEQQQAIQHARSGETTRNRRLWSPESDSSHIVENAPPPSPFVKSDECGSGDHRKKRSLRKRLGKIQIASSSNLTVSPLALVSHELQGREEKNPTLPPKDRATMEEPATLKLHGGSLLEVEIPSIQLERFSIMFDNLLHPQPQVTLMAHRGRQRAKLGTADDAGTNKLKSLIDTCDLRSPVRPRSTSPAKSPTLSLFPSASTSRGHNPSRKQPQERSLLHRSATPTGLSSPYRSKCDEVPQCHEQDHALFMVHAPLEGSKALACTQSVSRHSQTSTEASFHSASETLPLQITPKPAASQPKFPHRTSSDKGGQRFRRVKNNTQPTAPPARVTSTSESVDPSTAETHSHFESKPFADLEPLTLNPPTSRSTRSRPYKTRQRPSKGSTGSSHAVVETVDSITKSESPVSRKKPELEPGDRVEIRRINAVAATLVAPQAPKYSSKGKDGAGVVAPAKSAMLSTFPTVPSSAQQQQTSRRPNSPPTQQEISLTTLRLPPIPYSGSGAPDDLKDAAEMSIARQISISHQQRERLVPIVPKVARQPMLVDVSDGSQVARKSQHLVLEDA